MTLGQHMKLVVEEIKRYKWIESEKIGRDIGEYIAAKQWIERYYDDFFRTHKIDV